MAQLLAQFSHTSGSIAVAVDAMATIWSWTENQICHKRIHGRQISIPRA
jgi:hypothetical protein